MARFAFGDIVLLKFPYTDGENFKRRPALIINDFQDDDILVCRITSKIYQTYNDVIINDWEKAGLKLPSVIRVHKLATLEKDLVEVLLGQIDIKDKNKVRSIFGNMIG